MDKIFILILTGFILLSVIAFQYNSPQPISIEQVCDSSTSVCANCPLFQRPDYSYDINAYAYLLDNSPFSAMVSTSNVTFRKAVCKDYLQIINSSLNIQPNQYINHYLKEHKIIETHSFFLELPNFMKHTIVLKQAKDFIIFTKQSNSKPVAYFEKIRNAENLLRYSRIIGWSILIVLVITYTSLQIGFSYFTIDQFSKPLLQMAAIIFAIYSSSDNLFFEYFPLVQAIYLTVIYVRLSSQTNKSKILSTVWLCICVFQPQLVVMGQIYLGYIFVRRAATNSLQTNAVGLLILIGILTKTIKLLIPLNFFTFFHILCTIIFLPIAFLIIQNKLSRDNPPGSAK